MKYFLLLSLLIFININSQSNNNIYKLLELKGKVKSIEIKNIFELSGVSDGRTIPPKAYDTIITTYFFDKQQQLIKALYNNKPLNLYYNKGELTIVYPSKKNLKDWTHKYKSIRDTIFFEEDYIKLGNIKFSEKTKYFFNNSRLLKSDYIIFLDDNKYNVEHCDYEKEKLNFDIQKRCIMEDYFRKEKPVITEIVTSYDYLSEDKYKNWTKRIKTNNKQDDTIVEIRKIEYY